MKPASLCLRLFAAALIASCQERSVSAATSEDSTAFREGSFGYDLQFLRRFDSVVVLEQGPARLIVSPRYQAKVFTSTATGDTGSSFGWINYKAFTAPPDPHMNAYGGENRFWLGPEGGKYALFFPPGSEMVFANWKTPGPIDSEAWNITGRTDTSVSMQKAMKLQNYAGTPLELSADRDVAILSRDGISRLLGLPVPASLQAVGYRTDNRIRNTGQQEWTEGSGAPCIWILDMFRPSPRTVVLIPYDDQPQLANSKVATTDYFGAIPPDRVRWSKGILFFKADGRSRGKLGIGPERAKPVAGSFDADNGVLTITYFDVDKSGRYLNQEWNTAKPPYSGDAVNAYNDGPLGDGSQMGPFYEIESVSPAAFLKPGASLSHRHAVLHFTGARLELDRIARSVLGVSLEEIGKAFQ